MNKEIDIAFALLRSALGNTEEQKDSLSRILIDSMSTQNWWHLFRLMQQNHVAALTATALPAGIPRDVMMPWIAEQQKALEWHRYQREVQQEIVSVMQKHNIETLVLKGTHLSQYYPQPELREFGDLDLYFYDKHEEADRVARKALKVEVSNDAHHHSKYNYRGVTIESHYDFLNTYYPPSNRRYEAMLKELMETKDTLSTFHFPLSTFEILFLLRHMAGHFAASRITLRDLVDWTLTCKALEDKADWQLVNKTIKDYGMTDFVAAICQITENRMGVRTPLGLPNTNISNYHRIERDIIYGDKATADKGVDGVARLIWKVRRWRALAWKRRLVYNDNPVSLTLSSLTSHTMKPQSILHKQ